MLFVLFRQTHKSLQYKHVKVYSPISLSLSSLLLMKTSLKKKMVKDFYFHHTRKGQNNTQTDRRTDNFRTFFVYCHCLKHSNSNP